MLPLLPRCNFPITSSFIARIHQSRATTVGFSEIDMETQAGNRDWPADLVVAGIIDVLQVE